VKIGGYVSGGQLLIKTYQKCWQCVNTRCVMNKKS